MRIWMLALLVSLAAARAQAAPFAWIASDDQLFTVDDAGLTFAPAPPIVMPDDIIDIAPDATGRRVWVTTYFADLWVIDARTGAITWVDESARPGPAQQPERDRDPAIDASRGRAPTARGSSSPTIRTRSTSTTPTAHRSCAAPSAATCARSRSTPPARASTSSTSPPGRR
jgi:hypothetical protein